MLKLTIEVKEKNTSGECNVKISTPKNVEKATDSEKSVGAAVYQIICETLKNQESK